MKFEITACPSCRSPDFRPDRIVDGYQLVRCRACRFVYANPRPSVEALSEIYVVRDVEAHIDLYSRIATARTLATYDRRLETLERLGGKSGPLLDYGCAGAYFAQRAQALGWDAHGVDVAQWVEEAARRRGVRNVRSVPFGEAGFAPEFFSVINAAQVLEHMLDPWSEVRNLLRLLKPGGLFYVDVPNYRTLSIVLNRDDFELNAPPQHINYFDPRSLARLLESCGLKILELGANDGLKWETIMGRKLRSEIADAYSSPSTPVELADAWSAQPYRLEEKGGLRRLADAFFYSGLKVGMNLYAFAAKI